MKILLAILALLLMTASADAAQAWETATEETTRDDRVPMLMVTSNKICIGTATLIGTLDGKSYYLTNHHMTPNGSRDKYVVVRSTGQFEAIYMKSDEEMDLALLYTAAAKAPVLPIAEQPPEADALVGIHGWTVGKVFGMQEGRYGRIDCDCPEHQHQSNAGWFKVSVGANQGQSGGPVMHNGEIVGIISGTTGAETLGPGVKTIRAFLGWK